MAGNRVTLVLDVDDKGTVKIKQFAGEGKKAMRDMERTSKSVGEGISRSWLAIGAAVGGALYGLQRASREFIEASNKQAKAVIGMDTTLKSMGRYTPEFSQQLQKMASSLQSVTNFGDEVTLTGVKFLATYGDITNDLMPRSIKAMQDLAALMGGGETSVVSAANMLGKASMGMVGALRRVGITVDAETFKLKGYAGMLEQIEGQVGGQAAAMRLATKGYEAIGLEVGDLKEGIGDLIKFKLGDFFEDAASGLSSLNERMRGNLALARERKALGEPEMIYGAELAAVAGGVFTGPTPEKTAQLEAEGAAFYTDVDVQRRDRLRAQRELGRIGEQQAGGRRTDEELSEVRAKTEQGWQSIADAEMTARIATVDLAKEIAAEKRELMVREDADRLLSIEARINAETEATNTEIALEKQKQEQKEQMAKMEAYARRQAMSATLQDMQTISQAFGENNKALFEAFKAFSIAQTIIDTYEGAQASYTALAGIPIIGPALGTAAAAAAVVAGMARVQAIAQTKPQKAQRGGVFDEPTIVEAGEAGPEAFVPLTGVNRRIPVEFTGAPAGGVNIYFNVSAVDAASVRDFFAAHGGEVAEAIAAELEGGNRRLVSRIGEISG